MASRPDIQPRPWEVSVTPALVGGLNVQDLPHLIDPLETPSIFNLRPERGELVLDGGFRYLDGNTGAVGAPAAIFGIPLRVFEFSRLSGTSESVLITTETAYHFVSGHWELISDGVDDTMLLQANAGDINLSLTDYTGFVVGRPVGIFLDDGSLHMAKVVLVAGFLRINPGIPVGRNAPIGAVVYQAPLYTATHDSHVTGVILPSADWLVFTNETDPPQRYDGATVVQIPGTAAENIEACTTLSLWKGYLLLGGVKQSGVWRRWRVFRSDVVNFSEWTNGDAGFDDLSDSKDDILCMRPLGDYNIIYRARSIIRQEFVGTVDSLFRYRSITYGSLFDSTGIGVVGPSAVFPSLDRHFFVASDGVYQYTGGYSAERISEKVDDAYFSRDGILRQNDLRSTQLVYDEENHLLFLLLRTSDASTAYSNRALILDVIGGGWFVRKFAFAVHGSGIYRAGVARPWGSLIGSWAEQGWVWGGAEASAASPRMILGVKVGTAAWRTAEYGFAGKDLDEDIPFEVDTRDITLYDRTFRTDRVEAVVFGEEIRVSYSTDRGKTWTLLAVWTPTERTTMIAHHQVVAKVIRYRLWGNGGGAGIGEITFKMREESRW